MQKKENIVKIEFCEQHVSSQLKVEDSLGVDIPKIKNEDSDDTEKVLERSEIKPALSKSSLGIVSTSSNGAGKTNASAPPRTRTRLVLDHVYIDSSQSDKKFKELQEALARLRAMRNPKLKIKKKDEYELPLNPNTLLTLLDQMKPYAVTIAELERSVTVSREFMNSVFGGGTRKSFVKVRLEKFKEHGYNDFAYLTTEVDSLAPSLAGQPGLFFSTREAFDHEYTPVWMKEPYIFRVFTRLESSRWLYQGQYKFAHCKTLTAKEWGEQGEKVQNTWAQNIAQYRWGADVRGRIAYREQSGRDPSAAQLKEMLVEEATKKTVAFPYITKEKVLSAFQKGKEHMVIWKMECVGYDEGFQRRIAAEFRAWELGQNLTHKYEDIKPVALNQKVETGVRQRYMKNIPQRAKVGTKKRGEQEEVVQYVPRGTRSRPLQSS
ncbi:hypothetical protein C8J55DRAFT_555192 [Lentinula edodes]|uniref:DUF6697 domain-containing protein n=1 Tax=Lentinula lateritia TaxID=40482 RepID=A0A9W9DZX6_9AGAR|nr:hypothetical protein C8J55DRAFT_555192 [Lentinula edodes]